jgi:hypothetical protein
LHSPYYLCIHTTIHYLTTDAKLAHEGEEMAAYYDVDKKCWVFPGEEDKPPPAPVGAPPTSFGTSSAPANDAQVMH